MYAVRIHRYGGPEELVYEQVPDPTPKGGEVLLRMAGASINPVDLKMRSGAAKDRFPVTFPGILGRDVSGTIEAIGPGVNHFTVGQQVAGLSWHTYAELVLAKVDEITHIPDGVDPILAAAYPLVTLTADQLVREAARVHAGHTVLVTAALGGVGRAAVHVARKAGATVIAGVRSSQIEQAYELNANDIVALDDDKAIKALPQLDAVADTLAGPLSLKLLKKIKEGGSFGTLLAMPEKAKQFTSVHIQYMRTRPDASKVREFLDEVRDGKFHLPIRTQLPLSDAAEAHRMAEQGGGSIGKIILF